MNYFIIIPFIIFLANIATMLYALVLDIKSRINISYALLSFNMALWMLITVVLWMPSDNSLFIPLLKAQSCFYFATGFLLIHFIFAFLRKKNNLIFFLFTATYIITAVISIQTDLIVKDYALTSYAVTEYPGPLFEPAILINILIPVVYSLILLLDRIFTAHVGIIRMQLILLTLAITSSAVTGMVFALILPAIFYIEVMKEMSIIGSLLQSIIIFIAIIRYRFLSMNMGKTAGEFFANVSEGIIIIDNDDSVKQMNDFALNLFTTDRESMGGINIKNYIPDYDVTAGYHNHETVMMYGDTARNVSLIQSPVTFKDFPIGKLLIITDITERKKMISRLHDAIVSAQSANKAKSQFLANMSHELRTPLNSILGFSQLLALDGNNLTDPQMEYVEHINKSGKHLLAMVNDLLDLSRIDSGKISVRKEKFDIRTMLSQFPLTIKPLIDEKGLNLQLNVNENLGIINADMVRVNQIIYNLLSNAIKFTDAGKSIGIDARGNDGTITIEIWDEGPGIPEDEQKRLFEPFSQVGTALQNSQGTGLGLSISKHLADLHDGDLNLVSTPGKGSRFILTLPGRMEDKRSVNRMAFRTEKAEPASGRSLLVLVVEDNMVNLKLITSILKTMDHRVDFVKCGEDAITAVQRESYDLILMDIQLPGMDGIAAMEKIKMINSTVPIIALTAYAMKEDQEKFLLMGFDDYIPKPISIKLLQDKIVTLSTITSRNR
ncbi:MAG: hypothetical protein CVV44_02145 [Spirochaetae bacterium HGW-Spirochaetae-1]|jgi:signal transduction histidine kinase|nr:MAG: hypothetical protein CVV44_02145 [Spirochaetae bacterium HGW-Spirochaetae-1]